MKCTFSLKQAFCLFCVWASCFHFDGICTASELSNVVSNGIVACRVKDYHRAIDLFSRAIRIDANCTNAYSLRGYAYGLAGQSDKAIKDLNKSLRFKSDSYTYVLRGSAFMSKGEFALAVEDFSSAINISPKYADAYYNRANAYSLENQYDKAIADFGIYITNEADIYYPAYELRSWLFYKTKNFKGAIADFSKLIDLGHRNSATNYAIIGLLYASDGDFTNGIADCERAVHLDANSFLTCNNLAWVLAICPDANLRDGQRAVKYAKKAGELCSWKEPHVFGTLAAAYAEIGDFKAAVWYQKKSVRAGFTGDDLKEAEQRLEWYKQNKPYHQMAKRPIQNEPYEKQVFC